MSKIYLIILSCTACIVFNSCHKELIQNTGNPLPGVPGNSSPVALAGPDQVITLPVDSILLNAASSYDIDGSIVSYQWSKIVGPGTVNIKNASSVATTVNNLIQGTYYFGLLVTDNGGLFARDTIMIIVNPVSPAGSGNSSVFFWTRDIFFSNNPINININNQTKILDESWGGSGDPKCYPYGGSMDFTLPAGTYPYKTWRQGRDTIRGSANVAFGICNSIQISY